MQADDIRFSSVRALQLNKGIRTPALRKPPKDGEIVSLPQQEISEKDSGEILTNAEQEYFEKLFPSAVAELRSHLLYQKDGSLTGKKVGSVIDRRG